MASNTRVEWMLRYDDGRTQEITLTGDTPADTTPLLQKLAGQRIATLLRRTITTTGWVAVIAAGLVGMHDQCVSLTSVDGATTLVLHREGCQP